MDGDFADLTPVSPDEVGRQGRAIGRRLCDGVRTAPCSWVPLNGGARTLGAFDQSALGRTEQGMHHRFAWDGQRIRIVCDFGSGEVISRNDLVPAEARSPGA